MRPVAIVKGVRIVQKSMENCLHAVPSAMNLPFHIPTSIVAEIAERVDLSSGELQDEEATEDMEPGDSLLALAGTLEFDPAEIAKFRDPATRAARQIETRVKEPVKGAEETDSLLALAGTLECNVSDISERHDDYIGDTLLEELWGDMDE